MNEAAARPRPARPRPTWLAPAALVVLAALVRAQFLYHPLLDADMTVTGLMARHILEGHFPIFFYGQPYCGSIEAFIAAPIFALLGASTVTLCLAPLVVSLVFVWLVYLVCRDMWGRTAGLMAMALAAVPPYHLVWHSVLPRAAYIEIPTLSLILVWLCWRLVHRRASAWLYFLYGLVAGVGLWTHFLISYALCATALYLLIADWRVVIRRSLPLMLGGFFLGGLPLWIYNLQNQWGTFTYLLEQHAVIDRVKTLVDLAVRGWPMLMGFFWDGELKPVIPVASYALWALSAAGLLYILWLHRRDLLNLASLSPRRSPGGALWLLMLLAGLAIIVVKGESVASTRRHLIPFFTALLPLGGYALASLRARWPRLAWALLGLFLASDLAGTLALSQLFNPQLRASTAETLAHRQGIIEALLERGVTTAYAHDYWIAQPLTFTSGERLLVVLPDMELDHFYEPNSRLAGLDPRRTYITFRETEVVQHMLNAMGATYQTLSVGPYTAFYDVSGPAHGLVQVPAQGWRATATPLGQDAWAAVDQDALTRWSPLANQIPGQVFELDLGREVEGLAMLRLCSGRGDDQPRDLIVWLSSDGEHWRRAVKTKRMAHALYWGGGLPQAGMFNPRMDIAFSPQAARFVRLEQVGESYTNYWSLQEISLYTAAPAQREDFSVVLARVRALGLKYLYVDDHLEARLPAGLRPPRQNPPANPNWPMAIYPRDVLPDQPEGAGVVVEAYAGEAVASFLARRGVIFQRAELGGFVLFWDLRPAERPARAVAAPPGLHLASSRPGAERLAMDGDPATRWDSGRNRRAGDHFSLDLGGEYDLGGLILDSRGSAGDLPPDLKLELSDDGQAWREVPWRALPQGPIIFAGDRLLSAQAGLMRLEFEPQRARRLRLSVREDHPRSFFSLHEITLLAPDRG